MDKERILAEATNKGYKPGTKVKSLDNTTAKIVGKPFIHSYHTNLVVVEATPEFDPKMVLNITIYDDQKQKWAQII